MIIVNIFQHLNYKKLLVAAKPTGIRYQLEKALPASKNDRAESNSAEMVAIPT